MSLRSLDPEGARPFDRRRKGLTVGEGAVAIALERGEGRAHGWLAGYGARCDANHITGPARDGSGLVAAVRAALGQARAAPEEVAFFACHGTGTPYNDQMESVACGTIFGAERPPVFSIKGAIGHLLGGAGLANVVLAVRGLEEGICPPTAGLEELDPAISANVVFARPVAVSSGVAIASASGFAGVNAAVVLRRDPGAARAPARARRSAVITAAERISADRASLAGRVGHMAARRLDDLCLAGMAVLPAVLEAARLPAAELEKTSYALWLGTALGCLESDFAYYNDVRSLGGDRANPRIFAYTLPNVVLGEIAIAHKLTGESVVVTAGRASGLAAVVEAARAIERGDEDVAVVFAIDVVGPAARRLFAEALHTEPVPMVAAFVLESEGHARTRGAPVRAKISHTKIGTAVPRPAERPARDPLGAGGIGEILAAIAGGEERTVDVDCAAGYFARVEVGRP